MTDDSYKEEHRQQMLAYLRRDVENARAQEFVLGFKVGARTDCHWVDEPCPKARDFTGLYLPDELPDLYPADCLSVEPCSCVLREIVLAMDDGPDGQQLRGRMTLRGLPIPPPTAAQELAYLDEWERNRFAGDSKGFEEHRSLVQKIVSFFLRR